MGVECLKAVAWEVGRGQTSPFALVEEAKEEEDNREYDHYVEIIVPCVTTSVRVIRSCWSSGCRRGRGSGR
jgi:hypothetical protein